MRARDLDIRHTWGEELLRSLRRTTYGTCCVPEIVLYHEETLFFI